ncbi:MAG: acyl-CoA dehydrogenase family protein, partial [Phycisphaerales bacterium JB038]
DALPISNFFTDNEDIRQYFDFLDVGRVAAEMEDGYAYAGKFDGAPADASEAIAKYRQILDQMGQAVGEHIAPTAQQTDEVGNVLNDDNTVTYAPGIAQAIQEFSDLGVMGFTLPYQYGGLNCPSLIYTMSIDIVSRADASLMNLYGLQGIAETINAFADDEIKQQYLPGMASGELTGAMVLTEPQAGSDLQSVQVEAHQDEAGNWFIKGKKRFITNGCGDVQLVLARSEPEITDGRGLSLFLTTKGPKVQVKRLENKVGINGSPTCELYFDEAPAKLIGERQQGLVKYVMALMYGARMGVAAQSLGIAEAAYRYARGYAAERKQFGTTIDSFPAVREMLVESSIDLYAARALTYFAAFCVDIGYGLEKKLESGVLEGDEAKQAKQQHRVYRKVNGMLTPMAKYWASEMCLRVANYAISIMGGNGYMHDHPVERLWRDSRITSIYEGTSQMQIVAAVGGVTSGVADQVLDTLLERDWPTELQPLLEQIQEGRALLSKSALYAKEHDNPNYRRLYARKLTDMAIFLIVGALLLDQARINGDRLPVATQWLAARMPEVEMNAKRVLSGEALPLSDFEALTGAEPALA